MSDVVREALTQHLKKNTTLDIFPEVLPQGLKGGVVVTRTFVNRYRSKTGLTGLTESRVTITAIGERKLSIRSAADSIEALLTGFNGNMEGVQVKVISLEDQDDAYDEAVNAHLISSVYKIIHLNEEVAE